MAAPLARCRGCGCCGIHLGILCQLSVADLASDEEEQRQSDHAEQAGVQEHERPGGQIHEPSDDRRAQRGADGGGDRVQPAVRAGDGATGGEVPHQHDGVDRERGVPDRCHHDSRDRCDQGRNGECDQASDDHDGQTDADHPPSSRAIGEERDRDRRDQERHASRKRERSRDAAAHVQNLHGVRCQLRPHRRPRAGGGEDAQQQEEAAAVAVPEQLGHDASEAPRIRLAGCPVGERALIAGRTGLADRESDDEHGAHEQHGRNGEGELKTLIDDEEADQRGDDDGETCRDLRDAVGEAAAPRRLEVGGESVGQRLERVRDDREQEHAYDQGAKGTGERDKQKEEGGNGCTDHEIGNAPSPSGSRAVGDVAHQGLQHDAEDVVHAHEQADECSARRVFRDGGRNLRVVEVPHRFLSEDGERNEHGGACVEFRAWACRRHGRGCDLHQTPLSNR
nr:hypothetical protein [Microbacterium suwonense]